MVEVHVVDDIAKLIEFGDAAIQDNGEHFFRSPRVAEVFKCIYVEVKAFDDFIRSARFYQILIGINGNGSRFIRFGGVDVGFFRVFGVKAEGAAHIVDRVSDVKLVRIDKRCGVFDVGAIVDTVRIFRIFSIHSETLQ